MTKQQIRKHRFVTWRGASHFVMWHIIPDKHDVITLCGIMLPEKFQLEIEVDVADVCANCIGKLYTKLVKEHKLK